MRIVGYIRVSDKEQVKKGFSIPAQEEAILEWAEENKHDVVRVFTGPGRSGTKSSRKTRPTFEHAVNLVLAGVADGLVVKWMDRFARNVEDFLRVRSLFYQAGKYLISISEPLLNGDPADPVARYISVAIMNAYQLQAELSGLKAAQGRECRARQGNYPGSLPIGYQRTEDKRTIPDPDYWPLIAQSFADFASGRYTLDTWTIEAKQRDYKTRRGVHLNKGGWQRIFRNRFYIGTFTWKGVKYIGDYETFVDQTTFTTVQEILDSHGTGASTRKYSWLLSGFLWSEVIHKQMAGALVKKKFGYYVAQNKGSGGYHGVPARELEERVVEKLSCIMWDGERPYSLPEQWRLAIKMADTMKQVFMHLEAIDERQKFLGSIFLTRGIHVSKSGRIDRVDLMPGFLLVE